MTYRDSKRTSTTKKGGMIPKCKACGHGQAGHGGRRCIVITGTRYEGNAAQLDPDMVNVYCGCKEPARIEDLKQVIQHYKDEKLAYAIKHPRLLNVEPLHPYFANRNRKIELVQRQIKQFEEQR